MKVSLKTISGAGFQLDVGEDLTVAEVKAKVREAQGEGFPPERQVLIYKGAVLKDDTTLAANKVTEDGFMVVTVMKAKAAPKPAPPKKEAPKQTPPPKAAEGASTTQPSPTPATPAAAAPTEAEGAKPPGGPEAMQAEAGEGEAPQSPNFYQDSASNLATGSQLEASISMICDMGFPREQVLKAMRAAFNNPDRAVDYLMSGIPEPEPPAQPTGPNPTQPQAAAGAAAPPPPSGAAQPPPPAAAQATPPTGQAAGPNTQPLNMFGPQGAAPNAQGAQGGAAAAEAGDAGALDFMRSNPQFRALRAMVQANPQILQPMLQELGRQNQQLLQVINANQAEFLRMLNEPVEGADLAGMPQDAAAMQEGQMPPNTISVTPEEKEAIDRLESMGFDRALCIEAFLACDKNEALAANYLLEHGQEDME